jgi:hypothetical protein
MTIRTLSSFAISCAIALLAPMVAHAQATRTWVSGVGDDANPCSRTAPCKTFAGAISKTAAGGEINALDPGGFGTVTITKSITISGEGTLAGVLATGVQGIIVNAGPTDVVILRNLDIVQGTNGVSFFNGGALHIEKCQISGFTQNGVLFEPNTSASLYVTDTWIRNNGGSGIEIVPGSFVSATATVDRTYLLGNLRGLRAQDASSVTVRNSVASGNSGNGFLAMGNSRTVDMSLESSQASSNGAAGVLAGSLATVRVSRMMVTHNGTGLGISGGQIISAGNNTVQGNTTDGGPSSNAGQM